MRWCVLGFGLHVGGEGLEPGGREGLVPGGRESLIPAAHEHVRPQRGHHGGGLVTERKALVECILEHGTKCIDWGGYETNAKNNKKKQ